MSVGAAVFSGDGEGAGVEDEIADGMRVGVGFGLNGMVASTGWAVAAAATNLTGATRSLSASSCFTRVSSCSIRWSICCSIALSTATVLPLSCPRITGLLQRRASPRRNTRALVFAQFCLPVRGPVRGSTADDLMTTSSGAGIASCRPVGRYLPPGTTDGTKRSRFIATLVLCGQTN